MTARIPNSHLFILLVGAGRTGKDTIGEHLKRRRGFARTSFARPLYDAVQPLYGIDALELLAEDKDAIIPRLGRSLREIVQHLGDHARAELGPDILIRRLVERCVARGEWMQTDFVITDGRTDLELEWARQQGASVWWIRRQNAPPVRPHPTESIGAMHIKHGKPADVVINNDGGEDELLDQVDAQLLRMKAPA
jgi:hypothetical protein